jgi:hypothetical protein
MTSAKDKCAILHGFVGRLNQEGVGGTCRMHGELRTIEKIQWISLKATSFGRLLL